MKFTLLTLFGICLLTGCATSYQPLNESGGYYHKKFTEEKYAVGFVGNGFTNYQESFEHALRRALEIGEGNNFSFLLLEGERNLSSTEIQNLGSSSQTYGSFTNTNFASSSLTQNHNIPVTKPESVIFVKFFKNKPDIESKHLIDINASLSAFRQQ